MTKKKPASGYKCPRCGSRDNHEIQHYWPEPYTMIRCRKCRRVSRINKDSEGAVDG